MTNFDPNIVTLLFPAKCVGCEQELSTTGNPVENRRFAEASQSRTDSSTDLSSIFDVHWCRECWSRLFGDESNRCYKCGATYHGKNPLGQRCALCWGLDLRFDRATSIGNYRGLLQDLVIRMKNQHDEQLAIQLGYLMAYQVSRLEMDDELDLVVPVPTHWWRRFERGFHAAEVLAETAAKTCQLPFSRHVLRCLKTTKKQGTLSTPGRFANVRGAFGMQPNTNVSGLTILLIDDVMTSGATVSELARLMIREGAAKVYAGVIARGARVR